MKEVDAVLARARARRSSRERRCRSAAGIAVLRRAPTAIAPIGTLWVNAIRMTVIPLVVSLLITGVAATRGTASDRAAWRAHAGRCSRCLLDWIACTVGPGHSIRVRASDASAADATAGSRRAPRRRPAN